MPNHSQMLSLKREKSHCTNTVKTSLIIFLLIFRKMSLRFRFVVWVQSPRFFFLNWYRPEELNQSFRILIPLWNFSRRLIKNCIASHLKFRLEISNCCIFYQNELLCCYIEPDRVSHIWQIINDNLIQRNN